MSVLAPAVHTWIDKVAEAFGNIDDGGTGTVRSYKLSELVNVPGDYNPELIPYAEHYVLDCQPVYSMGGPTILYWEGRSDFHLTKDVKPANFNRVALFYPRILAAAMAHVQLWGTVNSWVIPEEPGAMRFITFLNPDNSASHQGLQVRWRVKQSVTGSYTISA